MKPALDCQIPSQSQRNQQKRETTYETGVGLPNEVAKLMNKQEKHMNNAKPYKAGFGLPNHIANAKETIT